jgi:hypothetical protein
MFIEIENIVQKAMVVYFKELLRNSHPVGTGGGAFLRG